MNHTPSLAPRNNAVKRELPRPEMSTLRLLTDAQVDEQFGSLSERLNTLELALYRTAARHYWIGATTDNLAEHDRWVFYGQETQKFWQQSAPRWHAVLPEMAAMVETSSIYQVLDRAHMAANLLIEWRAQQGYAKISKGEAYALRRILKLSMSSEHPEVLPPLAELHEMLYHFETWSQAHPEFEGLPRDLVLRAHGLRKDPNHWPQSAGS